MQLFDFQILTDISDVSFKLDSLFAFVGWRSSQICHDTSTTKDIHSIINILLTQLKLLIADSSKAVFLLNSSTIIFLSVFRPDGTPHGIIVFFTRANCLIHCLFKTVYNRPIAEGVIRCKNPPV